MAQSQPSDAWQSYIYPDTGTLRNKLDERDGEKLQKAERSMTTRRLADLPRTPHTPEGYKQIHKHLFQDVYEWAGKVRNVEMHRSDPQPDGSVRRDAFIQTRYIEQGLTTAFNDLNAALPRVRQEAKRPPKERDVELVAQAAAMHVGGLNYVHAFRDGNGRAMRAQVDNVSREAGLRLNEEALDLTAWNRGSAELNRDPANTATLARAVAAALEPRELHAERVRQAKRGVKPPTITRPSRDVPGPRDERDYDITD